jgi:hypothetical protein
MKIFLNVGTNLGRKKELKIMNYLEKEGSFTTCS